MRIITLFLPLVAAMFLINLVSPRPAPSTPTVTVTARSPQEDISSPVRQGAHHGEVLHYIMDVNAPRSEVFDAWTTSEGVKRFFSPSAAVELRVGGAYEVYFAPDSPYGERGSEGCHVLSWVEDEMISFSWNAPPTLPNQRMQNTFVVVRLEEIATGGTRVDLVHGGFGPGGEWDKVRDYFRSAWPFVLVNLQKHFDGQPRWGEEALREADRPALRPYVMLLQPTREDLFSGDFTPAEAEALRAHIDYTLDLMNRNLLMCGGPMAGPNLQPTRDGGKRLDLPRLGVAIVYAESDAEAQRILDQDPAIAAGVFAGQITPLRIVHQPGWVRSPDRAVSE